MEEYEVIHRPERNRFELEEWNDCLWNMKSKMEHWILCTLSYLLPWKEIAALVEATYKYASAQG